MLGDDVSASLTTISWPNRYRRRPTLYGNANLRGHKGLAAVVAADKELQAVSARELVDRFRSEKVFWRQFRTGKALAAANDRSVVAELEPLLKHDDRHLRGVELLVPLLNDDDVD